MSLEGLNHGLHNNALIERPFEQIKLDINQQNVNVKLIGLRLSRVRPTHAEIDAEKLMDHLITLNLFPKI